MTHAELICRNLWRQCVKYRDRWCVICGWVPMELKELEAHHIYFPRNLNWKIQFDVDFGAGLCFDCHHTRTFAPHINNEKFLEKILPRIEQDNPDRAAKLIEFLNNPKALCTERPDFKKIAAGLRAELKKFEKLYWWNQDTSPREISKCYLMG